MRKVHPTSHPCPPASSAPTARKAFVGEFYFVGNVLCGQWPPNHQPIPGGLELGTMRENTGHPQTKKCPGGAQANPEILPQTLCSREWSPPGKGTERLKCFGSGTLSNLRLRKRVRAKRDIKPFGQAPPVTEEETRPRPVSPS